LRHLVDGYFIDEEAVNFMSQAKAEEPITAPPQPKVEGTRKVNFNRDKSFQVELRKRVEELLESKGRTKRDCGSMYVKTAVMLLGTAATYLSLLFFATVWWQVVPLAILLGIMCAGIGFNIQHDGSHKAYSSSKNLNKWTAMSIDLIGGSSYFWRWQHVVYHHTYPNIEGMDNDIDLSIFGRMSPQQKHYFWHRWQHLYLWPLYGLMAIKWQLYDDARDYVNGASGQHKVPRPKGFDLIVLVGGKLIFYTLAFVVPMLMFPPLIVLGVYLIAGATMGVAMSVVFQLAHCVAEAEFPEPDKDTGDLDASWAVHQLQTTVDFARDNKAISWFLGGLNFQVEHHLFPMISHVNYPVIAKLVEETCKEYSVTYISHRTFLQGLGSHYKFLRDMGKKPSGLQAAA
jgi:linoleoyl-CoA desaturase